MILRMMPAKSDMATPFRDHSERDDAIDRAFHYRGDVTLHLTSGQRLTGYVGNRQGKGTAAWLLLLLPETSAPRRIDATDILAIEFSGKDAAEGKSWQAWLLKVAEAEAEGRMAELYPDP